MHGKEREKFSVPAGVHGERPGRISQANRRHHDRDLNNRGFG